MAQVQIDPNQWLSFALRYFFAGAWIALGWAVAHALLIPHIPGI